MELVWSHDDDFDELTDRVVKALVRESVGVALSQRGAHVVELFCATLAANAPPVCSVADWEGMVSAVFDEIEEAFENADADALDESCAAEVVDALRANMILDWQFAVGTRVLAVLEEDEEWHDAVVSSPLGADGRQEVTFVKWPKQQVAPREELCATAEDDDDVDVPGTCQLCRSVTRLTFHHLIPKEMHPRYIGKPPPPLYAAERGGAQPCTKAELGAHGILVCRPCHSAIHRAASNALLAARYCTLEALLDNPDLQGWLAYARGRRR